MHKHLHSRGWPSPPCRLLMSHSCTHLWYDCPSCSSLRVCGIRCSASTESSVSSLSQSSHRGGFDLSSVSLKDSEPHHLHIVQQASSVHNKFLAFTSSWPLVKKQDISNMVYITVRKLTSMSSALGAITTLVLTKVLPPRHETIHWRTIAVVYELARWAYSNRPYTCLQGKVFTFIIFINHLAHHSHWSPSL